MFTGIITDIGKILDLKSNGDLEYTIGCNYEVDTLTIGGSIAHDGICLTVIEKGMNSGRTWYKVNVSNETINCTKLKNSKSSWVIGTVINLERSLKVGDELGGHIVTGHVDGVAKIIEVQDIGESTKITATAPEKLSKYVTRKGSIALNGTSLTINEVEGNDFAVNLIPHTKQNTTWNSIEPDDFINIEIDPIARYVARLNGLRE